MTFQPENNANPRGRPPGSKNKIGRDFHEAYEEAKTRFKHPYLLMMDWAHDESKPLEIRAAMIKEAASYTCTKPKITVRSEVPVLSSIEQAEAFLATIAAENDLDPIELMTAVRQWIDSKRGGEELLIKGRVADAGPQVIHIENSLPQIPGTNVVMPTEDAHGRPLVHASRINGHSGPELDGQVVAPVLPSNTADNANHLETRENTSDDTL